LRDRYRLFEVGESGGRVRCDATGRDANEPEENIVVVKRQWKIVSGGVVAAVTLGGGAALAHSASEGPEFPELKDVVTIQEVSVSQLLTGTTPAGVSDVQLQVGAADESPFSALTASQESESEPTASEPSEDSQSQPSVSEPSEESQSQPSVSEPSVSAESDD
jgi:hypothetical protein